jgi:hypothetical protein
VIRQAPSRLAWGVRELVWKVDEKVVWPVTDAVTEDGLGYEPKVRAEDREAGWRRYWPDLMLAAVLAAVAFLARRHGLPTDGLWLDDTGPAAALGAQPSQLLTVGASYPGYIAFLIGWSHLTGGSDASLAYPALIAGTLSPPLLYLALRACGYERPIGVLLGAALAAAQTDIVYSGRLRTYTIDLLIVLGLVMIIPALVRMRWRWYAGVAWVVGATVIASFSGFALGAAAVAGAFIVLRPASDLPVRVVAVGTQAAATIALFLAEGRTYDYAETQSVYRDTWDAYPDFHLNPIQFGNEALIHLRRLAEVFPDGPPWLAMICGLAALAGLAFAATRGRQAIRARYLAALIALTFIGSLFGDLPFGPKEANPLSDGGRVSLWLVPVVAFGLAVVLHALRRMLANRRPLVIAFDLASYLGAIAILVSALAATTLRYPFPGANSAAEFVESQLGPRDQVLIPTNANWSFAAETSFDYDIDATPSDTTGFQPKYPDSRLHYVASLVDPPHIDGFVKHAERVMVYYPEHPFNASERQLREELAATLDSLGLTLQRAATFDDATVDVWGRGGAPAAPPPAPRPPASLSPPNLTLSDFPPGWHPVSTSGAPPAKRMLFCARALPAGNADTVVSATGPSGLNAISEVTQWPSTAGPRRASAALAQPAGAACVRSTLEAILEERGFPVSVSLKKAPPPAVVSKTQGVVAYRATARGQPGGPPVAEGSVLFVPRGRTSSLIIAFRGGQEPFPATLLSNLAGTLAQRVEAGSP